MQHPRLALTCLFVALSMLLVTGFSHTPSPIPSASAASTSSAAATETYIVQLADPPLVAYNGELPGLAATNPRARSETKLNKTSAASRRYARYLDQRRAAVLADAGKALGAPVTALRTYQYALNGMALRLAPEQAARVAALPGVVAVSPGRMAQQLSDTGPIFIGAQTERDGVRQSTLFRAVLSGAQETPPITTAANGSAVFSYDAPSRTLSYQISFAGLTPSAAALHEGAPGANGPPLADLGAPSAAMYLGSATLSTGQEAQLLAGNLYVNLRSAAHPEGEIRGQVKPNLGDGMLVGIIDGGINPTHPSFADPGPADGYDYTPSNPYGPGAFTGVCNPANANYKRYQPPFPCNDKLVGAWSFTEITSDLSPLGEYSPHDDDGHGSHVASTAAGNIVAAPIAANGLSVARIAGVAPHAHIIAYDVCTSDGCAGDAIIAALDQAVADGVDVINMSLGSLSRLPWSDPEMQALLRVRNAGIAVTLAAGNEGPDTGTIGSSSNAPWVLSVGNSKHNRDFSDNQLVDLSGGGSTPPAAISGFGRTGGTGAALLPIVYAGALGEAFCGQPFAPGSLSGKIVVCDSSLILRSSTISRNVAAGGAAGFIIAAAVTDESTDDDYVLPGIFVDTTDGQALKAWLAVGSGHVGRITGTTAQLVPELGDQVALSSSRGPDVSNPDVLKPDLSAPGTDIFAAFANSDAARAEYSLLTGTSMASPHVAGALALLRALHPTWTPAATQSALMTTATDAMRNEGGTPATAFDRGAGRIQVQRAALAGLVLDESVEHFQQADPTHDGDPRTLNLASMSDKRCVNTCTWTRVVRSTLAAPMNWTASATNSPTLTLSIAPQSFTLAPGAEQTIVVTATIDTTRSSFDTYLFGKVTLTPAPGAVPAASLPVAVKSVRSTLPPYYTINSLAARGSRSIDNVQTLPAATLGITVSGLVQGTAQTFQLAADNNPRNIYDNLNDGVKIFQVNVPVGTKRFVAETIASSAYDIDLIVHRDINNDRLPQPAERVCSSLSAYIIEYCDLNDPQPGTYLVAVQNFSGSDEPSDTVKLVLGVLPTSNVGNLTITAPPATTGQPFVLGLDWNLPTLKHGDRWYGQIQVGPASAGAPFSTTNVDLHGEAEEFIFVPLVRK